MLAFPTQINFPNSFPFDWCVAPLLLLGALKSPRSAECSSTMKKMEKLGYACPNIIIGPNTHLMVATSGFCWSLEPPLSGNVLDIIPAHNHDQGNSQQVVTAFFQYSYLKN